jgi:molecular chaperone DnaK
VFHSLDQSEIVSIQSLLAELKREVEGTNRKLIAELTEKMNALTTNFAQVVMNHAISKALQNRNVDEIA